MDKYEDVHPRAIRAQAFWNMRWPTLYLCSPLLGILLVNLWFGVPSGLWLMAGGFFIFSLMLLGILIRAEMRRVAVRSQSR